MFGLQYWRLAPISIAALSVFAENKIALDLSSFLSIYPYCCLPLLSYERKKKNLQTNKDRKNKEETTNIKRRNVGEEDETMGGFGY